MSERVKRFKAQARRLAGDHCYCGKYEPTHTTHECPITYLHYGLPGTMPVIPERKWCPHRRIEKALIRAYREGRAA